MIFDEIFGQLTMICVSTQKKTNNYLRDPDFAPPNGAYGQEVTQKKGVTVCVANHQVKPPHQDW